MANARLGSMRWRPCLRQPILPTSRRPPGVYRGFTNVSDEDSVLLTFVTGEVNARDDVAVPAKITNQIRDDYGEDVLDSFKAIATFHE